MTGLEIFLISSAISLGAQQGQAQFAKKRNVRQEEENKRAEARAALISSLTGQQQRAMPTTIQPGGFEKSLAFGAQLGSIGAQAAGYGK